ncbi:2-oxo acid dehydrogenase subunit E2 [Kitasatospora sp. LaBMicrA B282]|uniref:2-oxo acid dehydrogenase subunit E2 n=1 Tax=Kitasatospora sp. LaBMicrA B282 TaxID=3420949 RepID=UPI003D0EC7DD
MTGGTFTLDNYGVFGVDGPRPTLNRPKATMLEVGRIVAEPTFQDDELAVRQVEQLTFTFDHRVCDTALRRAGSCASSRTAWSGPDAAAAGLTGDGDGDGDGRCVARSSLPPPASAVQGAAGLSPRCRCRSPSSRRCRSCRRWPGNR